MKWISFDILRWRLFQLRKSSIILWGYFPPNSPRPSCRLPSCRTWRKTRCRSSTLRHQPPPPQRSPARTRSCHRSPGNKMIKINVWEKYICIIHVQCHPILVGRVTQLLLVDSFDKRDAPPVQIVTHKLVIVIILLIFPYLTGKGDSWKHIFPIRDNLSGNNGLIRKCWKHWRDAKNWNNLEIFLPSID